MRLPGGLVSLPPRRASQRRRGALVSGPCDEPRWTPQPKIPQRQWSGATQCRGSSDSGSPLRASGWLPGRCGRQRWSRRGRPVRGLGGEVRCAHAGEPRRVDQPPKLLGGAGTLRLPPELGVHGGGHPNDRRGRASRDGRHPASVARCVHAVQVSTFPGDPGHQIDGGGGGGGKASTSNSGGCLAESRASARAMASAAARLTHARADCRYMPACRVRATSPTMSSPHPRRTGSGLLAASRASVSSRPHWSRAVPRGRTAPARRSRELPRRPAARRRQ